MKSAAFKPHRASKQSILHTSRLQSVQLSCKSRLVEIVPGRFRPLLNMESLSVPIEMKSSSIAGYQLMVSLQTEEVQTLCEVCRLIRPPTKFIPFHARKC